MKHDVDTTWGMFSKTVQSGFKNKAGWEKMMFTNDPQATVEVGKTTVSGNSAKVTVKIMSGGQEIYTSDVSLVKENGDWKIEMP